MDAHAVSLYDIDLVTIDGKPQKMDVYRSKTLLIVNVASGNKTGTLCISAGMRA